MRLQSNRRLRVRKRLGLVALLALGGWIHIDHDALSYSVLGIGLVALVAFFWFRHPSNQAVDDAADFRSWAKSNGWNLDTGDSVFFAHTLLPLLVGSNRSKSIFDGYRGSLGEVPFYLGRLKVWQVLEEGETSVKFMDTVSVFELPCAFHNHLHIEPKSKTIATIDAATQESIRFESHEFTQAFKVHCKDKRFAYDIVNPSFMESLLPSPSVEVYLCTGLLLVNATDSNELSVESCKQLFSVGQGVLQSLPRHILRDAKALWREHHSVRS